MTLDFIAANGRDFRLNLIAPPSPPPAAGYPVLWLLDGPAYRGLAADVVRNRGSLGQEIEPALVVAVGYPTDDPAVWMSRRTLDFTATSPSAPAVPGMPLPDPADCGGLESFLDMLVREALPAVALRFAIDRQRMALAGHSLGGLAVLHALFTRPKQWQSYLALSPSIWWDGAALLRQEPGFAAQARAGQVAARIFIGVGSLEQTPPTRLPTHQSAGEPLPLAVIAAHTRACRMVDNAAELATRLSGLPGCDVRFVCLAGESHLSLPFAALGRALDLAFPPP